MVRYVPIYRGTPPAGTIVAGDDPETAWTVENGHRGIVKKIVLSNFTSSGLTFSFRIVPVGTDPANAGYIFEDHAVALDSVETYELDLAVIGGDRVQLMSEDGINAYISGIDTDQG